MPSLAVSLTAHWFRGVLLVGAMTNFAVASTAEPPPSRIVYPRLELEVLELGATLHVVGTSEAPSPAVPAGSSRQGFLYKLLRLDDLEPPVSVLSAWPEMLYDYGDSVWTFVAGDTLRLTLPLSFGGAYLFGVRAVDATGSEESDLELHRNALKCFALENGGRPWLTIEEPLTGSFQFHGDPSASEGVCPAGVELRFTWHATADLYGGIVQDYRWGFDLVDLEDEGPGSGWSEWSPGTSIPAPVVYSGGETHVLYVQARDTVGAITTGALVLDVVPMSFDREILLVDDSFDDTFPRDSEHDAFWHHLASAYAESTGLDPDQIFTFDVFGTDDRGSLDPIVPTLEELGRYKLLIWECRGTGGYNGQSALAGATGSSRRLAAYLSAGGKLWLGGRHTVAATDVPEVQGFTVPPYPKTDLGPGDFAYDYLKLHSTRIINGSGPDEASLLNRAKPFPPAPVHDRWGSVVPDLPYDSLTVDLDKLSLGLQPKGGVSGADAMADPILAEQEPGFRGDIDSLFVYGAAGPELQGQGSVFQNKLCALRWHDPDPDPLHGRVQWLGFPLYYMRTDQARRVFRESLDWFREEDIPVAVGLLSFDAARTGEGVVLRWDVAGDPEDQVFEVHRESPGEARVRVTSAALCCRSRYEYVDRSAPRGAVFYWLAGRDRAGESVWYGPVAVDPVAPAPMTLLAPVEPNPVFGEARFAYSLGTAGRVRLSIHDLAGRRVELLVDAIQEPGPYSVSWNPGRGGAARIAAGFYLVRLEAGGVQRVRRVILLK